VIARLHQPSIRPQVQTDYSITRFTEREAQSALWSSTRSDHGKQPGINFVIEPISRKTSWQEGSESERAIENVTDIGVVDDTWCSLDYLFV
jgi:hypothetical protein